MTDKAAELGKLLVDKGIGDPFDAYDNAVSLLDSGRVEFTPPPKCDNTVFVSIDFTKANRRHCQEDKFHELPHKAVATISGVEVTYLWSS